MTLWATILQYIISRWHDVFQVAVALFSVLKVSVESHVNAWPQSDPNQSCMAQLVLL